MASRSNSRGGFDDRTDPGETSNINRTGTTGADLGDAANDPDTLNAELDMDRAEDETTGTEALTSLERTDVGAATSSGGGQGRGRTEELRDRAREGVRSLADQVREQAQAATQQLRDRSNELVGKQKERVVDEVSHFSAAIRSAAEKLHEQKDDAIAGYVDTLADQVDRVSDYLRDRDLTGMAQDVANFARRRPEIVLGGMFLGGLLLARVLKAATASSGGAGTGQGYDAGFTSGGGDAYATNYVGADYDTSSSYASTGLDSDVETAPGPGATTDYPPDTDATDGTNRGTIAGFEDATSGIVSTENPTGASAPTSDMPVGGLASTGDQAVNDMDDEERNPT